LHENWMPAKLPPFQAPASNNTSNADSKIYSNGEYNKVVRFFEDELSFNPFCKRVNCYNINLEHTHPHSETKQEYVKKVVRFLKKWQSKARDEDALDQTELSQLSKVIKLWEEKNPFKDQREALLEHYNQTVFSNPVNSDVCLRITDKLKKEIEDGRITDDTEQPDDPTGLCNDCLQRVQAAQKWEKNYCQAIKNNCQLGSHYPISHVQETKIHAKCWKKSYKNDHNDIQPCGCSNIKSNDLLEPTSENLVKSFFVLDKVKSIKKGAQLDFNIEYLNGRIEVINYNQSIEAYSDLINYFQPLPVGQEVTRKDLGIKERDSPDDGLNLEKVRKEILGYFREHGIESIRLKNNKLVIKYNFKEEEEEEANSSELQQIQSYCQAKGINFLTLSELKKGNNKQESGYGKLLFYGGIALAVGLVIGLIAYLAYRSEKNGPRRY